MASKPLHLGWFMNFATANGTIRAGPYRRHAPWDGRFYVDMAKALERACFDYIMIEDTLMMVVEAMAAAPPRSP